MRIAMFGLGFMGATHLRALKKIPGVELVAVVSDVPQKLTGDLSDVQGNLGGPGETYDFSGLRRYADAFEAVRDRDVDAVDLCLPTHLHHPIATEALRTGKHVLVEKPMARNGAECDDMIAAARQGSKVLMVAQVLRFWPAYQILHDRLKSGAAGAVRSAFFRRRCAGPGWQRWVYNKDVSGGGVFDLLIHDVDACLRLFGKPEALSAVGHEDLERGIDTLTANFDYPGIGAVTVTGGWHHPKAYPFSMEFTVSADGGTFDYSSLTGKMNFYSAAGEVEPIELPEVDAYQLELEYFLKCCQTGRRPELCPPEESALATKLTKLAEESRRENGRKVEVGF